ncbi:hypothetical protein A3D80_04175 [Candidatus Roizmanbacteria bacterium RIFCSPHIGHO2_02_FULL_40_13b]|uniref:PIN domain-containing protein n=1 Tax=Candidatus Roizmanbacteria bacterium RIFCSPHIGHO2_01_FULL_39_24 TaxID=1802032 RepID=A0A1F7GL48_9BACT|nr:MAG: hypothetical protein A2799_00250 [Candidatus Roizmanbacteria bacterium RIFCSPHIGHO2_01_FULL_39_24]OGK27988.1 MAG: hypothetical protein A3D80_04175 [Candidatus Roizmanbacteria bacterium RIFCSPHIGHO2_02_FULL_40_13b]OGK49220.1 MAG: hypothetical protein A3A56_04460 [Candidatus Roizmanbacteria bacterium RIFCSPLOWO2_01_FULL_40_32]OGK57191.1 MAG: hypothetical protein A3H83_02980 [Candidatus Roizmanbacteria bacterium RIFCSPLOWO2_02_FULL_39_8]
MKSYFIDTNYFLRLLLKDNEAQFQKVYTLFEQAINEQVKIYTSVIVFFEIYWVLSSFYKRNKSSCVHHLQNILKMNFLDVENREILQEACTIFGKSSLDLEDSYNIAFFNQYKLNYFATFDKNVLKLVK